MIERYTSNETLSRAAAEASRHFSMSDEYAKRIREAGRSARRAEALRLVKAAKSPTDRFPGLTGAFFNRKRRGREPLPREIEQEAPHCANDLRQPGTWAVIEKRPWAGEWRVRMETRPGAGAETPDNAGDRWTEMLSERGARKISESCYFMAKQRGGFTTFATLTLNNEARERLTMQGRKPVYKLDAAGFPNPAEPARAKQGPLGVQYQTEAETPAYNVAEINQTWEPVRVHDPDFGPLKYNPILPPEETRYVWSLQKAVSRFFEAANKMFMRGWQYKRLGNRPSERGGMAWDIETRCQYQPLETLTIKVAGSRAMYGAEFEAEREEKGQPYTPIRYYKKRPECPRRAYRILQESHAGKLVYTPLKWKREKLAYLWVAENPNRTDETGETLPICDEHGEYDEHATNPHIHLMMGWRVDRKHFRHWAARLEKLWGHGFAHLEKIKDPHKAVSYVAKAAGYLTNGQVPENWQGEIRGNRYAISSRARAPGWIETERHQVGMMGWLLAEAHEQWNKKHGKKIAEREYLKKKLNGGEIRTRAGKIVKLLEEKRPDKRKEIGEELEKVRAKIEPLPRISKYAALFKSEEQKEKFFDWASRKGWEAKPQNSLWLEQWRRQQWQRRNRARLSPGAGDWSYWFALADAGAVACNDEEREEQLAI